MSLKRWFQAQLIADWGSPTKIAHLGLKDTAKEG
jgi:hypothetical protein